MGEQTSIRSPFRDLRNWHRDVPPRPQRRRVECAGSRGSAHAHPAGPWSGFSSAARSKAMRTSSTSKIPLAAPRALRDPRATDLESRGFAIDTIDLDPTYIVRLDGALDEDPILVLTPSAEHRRADAIGDAMAHVPCLAAVAELEGGPAAIRSGAVAAWSRTKRGALHAYAGHGPEILTPAWSSVAARAEHSPAHWRFRRHRSP